MNQVVQKITNEIEAALKKANALILMPDLIEELKKRNERVGKIQITSAVELTDEQKETIQKKLDAKKIDFLIDNSILGGLIIEKDGKRQDLSLKKKLNLIKKAITE